MSFGGASASPVSRLLFTQPFSAASSSSPLKVGFSGRPAPQAASFHEPAQLPWGSCQKAGSDSEVPGWGLQFCISDMLPGEGLAAALWIPSIYLGRLKILLLCVIYECQQMKMRPTSS